MRETLTALTCCLLCAELILQAAEPVMRVVKAAQPGTALLRNGGFEQVQDGKPAGWQAASRGFRLAPREGRDGSQALVCAAATSEGWFGASQTLTVDRTNVTPLVVRGWSKAENVSGAPDSGYSLYVDIIYDDDTPLWGQTGEFHCGTHDWEQREFVILPEKPVRTLTLHCILRGHNGTVWFDDVSVEEARAEGGAVLFQGVPVQASRISSAKSQIRARSYETRDGLRVARRDDAIDSLRIDRRELARPSPSGFLARDVAADSDFFGFERGVCADLGLKVKAEFTAKPDHIAVQGRVSDTTRNDRAVTLVFALPIDATGWRWGDDIHRSRLITGHGEFASSVMVRSGATGTMSLYPLAAIWDDRTGLALALDMAQPAQYRVGYHAGTKQLFIAYDFGLVPDTERFPSGADFRFVVFRFDPRWGFRAAWQKLMQIFPDYFTVRAKEQGIWMPFTDVSTVHGWQDFGFKFHEGNNNLPWDDANGILSFRYTEPMTWWMPMKPEVPRTPADAVRVRDELAAGGNESHRRMAEVTRTAAMFDEAGQPSLLFRNEPWCNGAVWSLNPNPWLGVPASAGKTAKLSSGSRIDQPLVNRKSQIANDADRLKAGLQTNAATVHWNDDLKARLYGPTAKSQLDGEYLDSLEGYVTAELNFRRDHFRCTTVPLTFSRETKRPALMKGLAVFEFTRWICDDVHRLGKLTFANGVPYRFTFLCPWLDVMGAEVNWLRGGKYQPDSDREMCLRRTLCGTKPYLLLMNTDYDAFTPDLVERYFQRALFYGVFPGFFSHNASENPYWQNPKWYERDRPLFRKYIPLIKRVAESGWQPVTEAACDNENIFVERFGPDASGAVFFTLFNDTAQAQTGTLRVNTAALGLKTRLNVRELISGETLRKSDAGWRASLQPQEVAVIKVRR